MWGRRGMEATRLGVDFGDYKVEKSTDDICNKVQ